MTLATASQLRWENRKVPRLEIATDPAFKTRRGRLDAAHVKSLVGSIRRGGALTPVTLWREEGRNSLVLLDGEHRLAAYRSAGWRGGVPARVVTCSRRDALLIAAGANTRDALPLSQSERADIAWRLVREPGARFTKLEVARASGIAERTVTTMRARWRTMQVSGREPSGDWWRDRKEGQEDEGANLMMMSEAERRAKVEAVAKKLRKAAGNLAFRDEQMFAEALDAAYGRRLRAAIDYLYEPEEVDEWLDTCVSDGADDGDSEDDPEPAF